MVFVGLKLIDVGYEERTIGLIGKVNIGLHKEANEEG